MNPVHAIVDPVPGLDRVVDTAIQFTTSTRFMFPVTVDTLLQGLILRFSTLQLILPKALILLSTRKHTPTHNTRKDLLIHNTPKLRIHPLCTP